MRHLSGVLTAQQELHNEIDDEATRLVLEYGYGAWDAIELAKDIVSLRRRRAAAGIKTVSPYVR
jgi:hypothetical protein